MPLWIYTSIYIEETLSISAVYTILSSRPQSFLASFSTLCTIHRSTALHKSYCPCEYYTVLIYCACISPFSTQPGLGDRGEGWWWGSWWGRHQPTLPLPAWTCSRKLHASCQRGFSRAESSPPSPAPRWTWQPSHSLGSTGPSPVPRVHALAVEGGVDRPRRDGAPGPGGTVGAGGQGLPAHGLGERGSWLATANRGDG